MASKRQPSKQRRQSQNQKQRAALEARRQAAATPSAPDDTVDRAPSSSSASGSGSVLSRFRGAASAGRTARTGGAGLPVGHRAALSGLLAAIAAALVVAFMYQVPVDGSGDAITTNGALVAEWALSAQGAAADAPAEATPAEVAASVDDWMPSGTQRYLQAAWPLSLAIILPVIGTALGFRAVSRRSPAKVVNRTMYVTLFGALLAGPQLLIFLPAVISLGVSAFQVRKAEMVAQAAAPPDDVIDVDEVAEPDDGEDRR